MAFHQYIAAVTLFPAMRDPNCSEMRGTNPAAVDPDVAVAIPAVITIIPHPTVMRRTVVNFNNWGWWSYANNHLRHCYRR